MIKHYESVTIVSRKFSLYHLQLVENKLFYKVICWFFAMMKMMGNIPMILAGK